MRDIGDHGQQLQDANVAIYVDDEDYTLPMAVNDINDGYLQGYLNYLTVETLSPAISNTAPFAAIINLNDMTVIKMGLYWSGNDAQAAIEECNNLRYFE